MRMERGERYGIGRDRVLIFMHIPKTAGISFRRMLKVKVGTWPLHRLLHYNETLGYYKIESFEKRLDRLAGLSPTEKARICYLEGHYGYGLHEYLDRPAAYLTLLREPIDRTISTYHHLTSPEVSRRYNVPRVPFEEMMTIKRVWAAAHFLDNCQVRYIAGQRGKPIQVPFGECTDEMLELALERLERFAFVGLTHRFDESVVLLKRALGWWFAYYKPRNISPTRPRKMRLSDREMELARRHNRLDLQLYQRGVELFEQHVAEGSSDFEASVERFRIFNRIASHLPLP
jgi:hypothetical protein